jgi:hypothetical protein
MEPKGNTDNNFVKTNNKFGTQRVFSQTSANFGVPQNSAI